MSLIASTGNVPTKRDGKIKVKINLIAPWKAPPWKRDGVMNSSKKPDVTEPESTKKKLVEKTTIENAKKIIVEKMTRSSNTKIW